MEEKAKRNFPYLDELQRDVHVSFPHTDTLRNARVLVRQTPTNLLLFFVRGYATNARGECAGIVSRL